MYSWRAAEAPRRASALDGVLEGGEDEVHERVDRQQIEEEE